MYFSSVDIANYKGLYQPDTLTLGPGFNIIIGKNNAGKTALVEALSFNMQNKPHRSEKTMPAPNLYPESISEFKATITITQHELKDILFQESEFRILTPDFSSDFAKQIGFENFSHPNKLADWLLSHETFTFSVHRKNNEYFIDKSPSFGNYSLGTQPFALRFKGNRDGSIEFIGNDSSPSVNSLGHYLDFGHNVLQALRSRIYSFSAQRVIKGDHQSGSVTALNGDASNLAEVLNGLQGNPDDLEDFNRILNSILPQIQRISVRPIGGGTVQVMVWNQGTPRGRVDLAIPLDECGTGVGQVLAILYVVFTSRYPQTIIIDEPQSFLHPGAVRDLLDVLKEYGQHQYILTTHSPIVIAATDPTTVTLIKQDGAESNFVVVPPDENDKLKDILSEIGASPTDVFGANDVLWVEGPTEEECFPLILRKMLDLNLIGTVIKGVKHTGDFELKNSDAVRKIYDIYTRLTTGTSLLPPALAFIFDREGRPEEECERIQSLCCRKVHFLPRRMYENYLLNYQAISDMINQLDTERTTLICSEKVKEWIEAWLGEWQKGHKDPKIYGKPPMQPDKWQDDVHGAKLLCELFADFSEGRLDYEGNKRHYSKMLTEWLIANKQDDLQELGRFLAKHLVGKR